jgi:hypothetical protein
VSSVESAKSIFRLSTVRTAGTHIFALLPSSALLPRLPPPPNQLAQQPYLVRRYPTGCSFLFLTFPGQGS